MAKKHDDDRDDVADRDTKDDANPTKLSEAEIASHQQVSDDILMTYNYSEATWLGTYNPDGLKRWLELHDLVPPSEEPEPEPEGGTKGRKSKHEDPHPLVPSPPGDPVPPGAIGMAPKK